MKSVPHEESAAISLGHSSKRTQQRREKFSISLEHRAAQNGGAAGQVLGNWRVGTSTHPVSFHSYVTFEPRKAILALRKTEVREYHRGKRFRELGSGIVGKGVDFRNGRAEGP